MKQFRVGTSNYSLFKCNTLDKMKEFDDYSKIDPSSMGGVLAKHIFNEFELSLIEPYIEKISKVKRKK